MDIMACGNTGDDRLSWEIYEEVCEGPYHIDLVIWRLEEFTILGILKKSISIDQVFSNLCIFFYQPLCGYQYM